MEPASDLDLTTTYGEGEGEEEGKKRERLTDLKRPSNKRRRKKGKQWSHPRTSQGKRLRSTRNKEREVLIKDKIVRWYLPMVLWEVLSSGY